MRENTYIHLKVKNELHKQLKEEANKMGLSLTSYINLIIYHRQENR